MKRLQANEEALLEAKKILKAGGVIIFPTETVYGIGTSVNSDLGVKRIYKIKNRSEEKLLQILISNPVQLNNLVVSIPEIARTLIKKYWPGPLTLIFKKIGDGTVGIRMPNHKVALELINDCGPLYATSANISGQSAPTSADEVTIKADLLLDAGPCEIKEASTVIDVTSATPKVIRVGAINV